MARKQRDFRAEYERRIARGTQRGLSRTASRGHGRTPERPLRALQQPERYEAYIQRRPDALEALANTPAGRSALARFNDARRREGKAPVVIGPPPYPSSGTRQFTTDSFEEAESRTGGSGGAPVDYKTIYIWSSGFTSEVRSAEGRRRRRAA